MKALEKKYLLPFALVTSLFLLWGLANNMTDTLLAAFKRIMDMSDAQTSLIQFAFYGSYFCFALPAAIFISRHSFKSGIILGLLLYAAGAILFLPAAYAASYGFYLVAIYIMAGGCSVLETTANPCFNPIGSIIGILMSKYFILKDISLYSVSGTYASLGLVLIAILVAILFVKMPAGRDSGNRSGIIASFGRLFRNRLYRYGVVAQFFYVGAQIGVWSFTIRIVMQELGVLEAQASTIYLITIIGFCLSRFIYTWLMKWISPAKLLLAGGVLSTLMTAVVVLGAGSGWLLIVALVLISFFMSLMFPTIYGLSLGGVAQSEHPDDAKLGASGLIMAILGGALLTPLQGVVSDNSSIYMSYIIPAICFVVVTLFAAYAVKTNKRIYA